MRIYISEKNQKSSLITLYHFASLPPTKAYNNFLSSSISGKALRSRSGISSEVR